MKKLLIILFFLCAQASAQQTIRLEYEATVPSADLAGSIFNAELLSIIKESKAVNLGSNLLMPRLRLSVVTTPIAEMQTPIAVWQVVLLFDDEQSGSTYIDSWVGYSGDLASKKFARDVASKALKHINDLHSSVTKPKT